METMDFKPGFEVFTSPRVRPRSEVAFNDMLMTNGFTGLFDDVFLGAESMHCDIFDELGENSQADDTRIIDVESIDELNGLDCPSRLTTFGSPHNLSQVFKQPALQKDTGNRVRHNSERMIVELDQLYNMTSNGLEHSISDEAVSTKLEEGDFSLFDIDGIEAEDLEALFREFEGAVTKQSPLKEKVASPVKAKPRPLTLDDYRRSRGLAVTAVPAASPEPVVSTSNPTIRKLGFDVSGRVSNEKYLKTGLTTSSGIKSSKSCSKLPQSSEDKSTKDPRLMQTATASLKPFPKLIPVGTAHPTTAKDKEIKRLDAPLRRTSSAPIPLDTLKAMPLPLQQPPNTLYNKASQKVLRESHSNSVMAEVEVKAFRHSMEELVHAIVLDHDYYCKHLPDRNIKAELTSLINKIPEYIAQTSSPMQAPSSAAHVECRCSAEAPKVKVSNPSVKVEAKQVELPKAYVLPNRGRPRKRRYRRSPSSGRSSSSSSSYDSESSDSSCSSCSSSRGSHRRRSSSYTKKQRRRSVRRHSKKHKSSNHSRSSRGRHHELSHMHRKRHRSISSSTDSTSSSRSPSPSSAEFAACRRKEEEAAHAKAMAERRVVYVGGIDVNYSKADLRKRFAGFGEIESVKTRLRDEAENYGFVTFYSKADAYAAIEKGNDVYGPKFNLGFGGRRNFCSTDYADLDGCQAVKEEWAPRRGPTTSEDDFDRLLKQSLRKMK
ncbi:peroxisome proliferator-activated receptor gamma coactivator-related protein 1-like [Watersipora subatra]|uniref:peroxisome proliferator-activated receptor gamma coactivator-related protein 1-like n=1 Tax=Watersipora subatra TaxID=2589382 RepID=UPI00355C9114